MAPNPDANQPAAFPSVPKIMHLPRPGLAMLALLLVGPVSGQTMKPSPQQPAHLSTQVTYSLHFLLALPEGYAEAQDKRWPLLVFLHGIGERGADLNFVKRQGLPRLIEEGKKFPFVIVSPQCPDDEWWNPAALEALIDRMAKDHRIDPDRIYLTGLSMGGYGVWALAQRRPGRYAAVIPICGGGEVRHAAGMRDLPLWVFHGAKDEVVLLKRSQEMVDAIKAAGGAPRFTIYPEAGHDAWTETYANPDIYTWLLTHARRPAASPAPGSP